MSKETASSSSLEAMRDADRHAAGDNASHPKESHAEVHGHEHTKPAGDLRVVADKEDRAEAQRGDAHRGH